MRIFDYLCLIRFVNNGYPGLLQKNTEYDDDRNDQEEYFPFAEESFLFIHKDNKLVKRLSPLH